MISSFAPGRSSLPVRKLGSMVLGLNEWIWRRLPPSLRQSRLGRQYGHFIHRLVLIRGWREPNGGTYLLRNRSELELIQDLIERRPPGDPFRIAVLGCSNGMELYSICWQLRDLSPWRDIRFVGMDLDAASVDTARAGAYSLPEHAWMLSRLSAAERVEILEAGDGEVRIRDGFRRGVQWLAGDACRADLRERLGLQDLVLANRFLCHMAPASARACLRNILELVAPGGYLFVSGVDLDVRQSVLRSSDFVPLRDRLPAIHEGDPSLLEGWPLRCWGLEPLDIRRADWVGRYAMVYQRARTS